MAAEDASLAAFEEVASPEEKRKAVEVAEAVLPVVAAAQDLQVRNRDEAQGAAEFLARIAKEKRNAEKARKFLTEPLNRHVKAINDRFRPAREGLEAADGIVRGRLGAYEVEAERRRVEEQARLDRERADRERAAEEERRRVEAEARAVREAAAREAARAETEAKAAKARREREMAERADTRRQEIAAMDAASLIGLRDRGLNADADMAREELAVRAASRRAQEAAAAARQREDEARAAEQAVREAPPPEVPVTELAPVEPLKAASGSVGRRKVWQATVTDPDRVPRQYMVVDQKKINAAMRAGERDIPGVTIEQVSQLAVRGNK